MRTDPLEMNDLASQLPLVVDALDLELRMHLDYPAIAEDAERYNKGTVKRYSCHCFVLYHMYTTKKVSLYFCDVFYFQSVLCLFSNVEGQAVKLC